MNEYLYQAMFDICLTWSVLITLPGIAYYLYRRFRKSLKRIISLAVQILSDILFKAQRRRAKRRDAKALLYVESINGTSGYRIITR